MNVLFFSSKVYEVKFFNENSARYKHKLKFLEVPLNCNTAVLAKGHEAVCIFVNSVSDANVLQNEVLNYAFST